MGKPTTFNKMPPITDAVVEIVEAKKGVEAVEVPARSTELKFGSIEIPLGPLPGNVRRRVEAKYLSLEQREKLASITSGLQFAEAKLKNGTQVRSESHAIRWVLENLTDSKCGKSDIL